MDLRAKWRKYELLDSANLDYGAEDALIRIAILHSDQPKGR